MTDNASEMRPEMRLLCNNQNKEFYLDLTESFHIIFILHVIICAEMDVESVIEAKVCMVRELPNTCSCCYQGERGV